jgi:putative flippase GtrA
MQLVSLIHKILDFFYPLVKRFFDKTTYYYAVCGVGNLVLSWILFFIFFQYVFKKHFFHLDFINFTFSAYTLSAIACFLISFALGFVLMKYIVFTESGLKGRVQLFRYAVSAIISALVSWGLLKMFIEVFDIFPSVANILASCLVVIVSYLLQRKFTFK